MGKLTFTIVAGLIGGLVGTIYLLSNFGDIGAHKSADCSTASEASHLLEDWNLAVELVSHREI